MDQNNQPNDQLLVQFPMLRLHWLKFITISIYALPFVSIWALGGRMASSDYDDLVCHGCRNAVSVLRDVHFVMQPIVQPVVIVLLLLIATAFQRDHLQANNNQEEP